MKPVITLGGFIIGDESFFNPSREVNNIFIVPYRRSAPRDYIYPVYCCCLLWILECKRKGRVGDKGLPPFQFENLGRGNFSAGGSRAALRRLVSSPQGILLRRISSHSVSPFLNIDLGSSSSNILCMHTGYFGKKRLVHGLRGKIPFKRIFSTAERVYISVVYQTKALELALGVFSQNWWARSW